MKLFALLLSLLLFGWNTEVFSAEGITFGDKPSFTSGGGFDYSLSPDKKALSIIFSDLVSEVDGKAPPAPIVTKTFSLVLPVNGGKKGKKLSTKLYFQGYAVATPGSDCTLIISINGKAKSFSFAPGKNSSFLEGIAINESSVSDVRMTVVLITARSGNSDGSAYLSVDTIDTDLAKAKTRKPKKK